MEIQDVLKSIGLDDKEARVYMALLELGTATVHPIANKAEIKRPTTYLILEQLLKKRFGEHCAARKKSPLHGGEPG